jgi:glycosyltransferase involved in cell wall biosynthesis
MLGSPLFVAVIVPIYNERGAIAKTIASLAEVRQENWEVILVNDGSNDGTENILKDVPQGFRVINHPSNHGYGASLKTGILSTRALNVLFFDADNQHDAQDVPKLVERLKTQECVFGERLKGAGAPLIRKPGKWILLKLCNFLTQQKIPDINCGFRGGRRQIYMRMLDILPDGYSFSTTSLLYILKGRFSFSFIPVNCRFREGNSSVRIVQDGISTMMLALRLIMLFDPMRVFVFPALFLILIGVIYQVFILITTGLHIEGGSVLSILAGIILFHFGLLSDQVASFRKEMSSHNSLVFEEGASSQEDGSPRASRH